MSARLHSKLIAALLAPALIASGAAQGMLLMRCGPSVRMTCCCPKTRTPPPSPTISAAALDCCSKLAVPSAPAQATPERALANAPSPVLVAVAGEAVAFDRFIDRARQVPRLDPPPGRSPVLVNCALLI